MNPLTRELGLTCTLQLIWPEAYTLGVVLHVKELS